MDALRNWEEEKQSAYLYSIMANAEQHPLRVKLFKNLSMAAEDQAKIWEKKIKTTHPDLILQYRPTIRTRWVGWLVKQIGPERLRYVLSSLKVRGMSVFAFTSHEHRHVSLPSANNLRAAVFGINDGLVSNMSLILGMMGANANPGVILLAGLAGLLAGACSMGAGEYISVKSQREVYEYQIELERNELQQYPEEEAEELSLIYQARGVSKEDAENLSKLLIGNPETALDTLAREELGLNPNDLVSPFGAMLSSFISFAIGAAIPVLPFLFGGLQRNLMTSMILTGLFLFFTGAMASLFTNRSACKSGFRMLMIGALAGGLTFFIGKYLGIHL